MAENEPTVIERMYRAYINADVVGPQAMLAAVRELKRHAPSDRLSQSFRPMKFHDGHSAWVGDVTERHLEEVIEDHERRAGGKGE